MPILLGFKSHFLAFLLTNRIASCASCNGPIVLSFIMLSFGNRDFKTNALRPKVLGHFATLWPSLFIVKCVYPPAGQITIEVPFDLFGSAKKLLTLA